MCLIFGLAAAVVAVASIAFPKERPPPPAPVVRIGSREQGFHLGLPEGFARLEPRELIPHLRLTAPSPQSSVVGFGNRSSRVYGALVLDADRNARLIGGCQEFLVALGAANEAVPVEAEGPAAFGEGALVYPLEIGSGRGRLGCARLEDGRIAFWAVVVQDGEPGTGARAFEQLGEGLKLY
jgi:hypothetical protein